MKKNLSKNRMTLEKIAQMIADGFESISHGFNNRFEKLERGHEEIIRRLDSVELHLDYLAPKFEIDDLKRRVGILERKQGITTKAA